MGAEHHLLHSACRERARVSVSAHVLKQGLQTSSRSMRVWIQIAAGRHRVMRSAEEAAVDTSSRAKIDETISSTAASADAHDVVGLHITIDETGSMNGTQCCRHLTTNLGDFMAAERSLLFEHLVHRDSRDKFLDDVDHSSANSIIKALRYEGAVNTVMN